ncbi:tetratricopeptide repeat protein [Saccharospirillum mangrovi]|uniref:tetratricopeptide repeat protein n=1 Tax=Saccharospirillum mangrovi TaxID=2161747 RepID=UPI000D3A97E4|nr:DUF4034 domain-containing protein [Saccharospirillum mangrovi]
MNRSIRRTVLCLISVTVLLQAQAAVPMFFEELDLHDQAMALSNALRIGDLATVKAGLEPCLTIELPDVRTEQRCTRLYADIVVLDADFQRALRNWVSNEPNNYHARLLIHKMLSLAAWSERGHGYSDETHPYHMHLYEQYQAQARVHLEAALSLRPDLPFAHTEMINLVGRTGSNADWLRLHEQALEQVPGSFELARNALYVAQPRWGGSYVLQDELLREYLSKADEFPDFAVLEDYLTLLRARDYKDGYEVKADPQRAVAMLTELAEKQYPWADLNWILADAYNKLDQPEQARAPMIRALVLEPDEEFFLHVADCTCYGLSDAEVIAIAERYVARYPTAFAGWTGLGYKYYFAEDYPAALDAFSQALELRPLDPRMHQFEQWSKDKLGIAYEDFRSTEYFKDLTVYSIESYEFSDSLKNDLRDLIRPQIGRQWWQRLDVALDGAITRQAIDTDVRPRLDALELSHDQWKVVSTFFADRAHIANHMKESYRTEVRNDYDDANPDDPINQVWSQYRSALDALGDRFIDELNGGSLENISAI